MFHVTIHAVLLIGVQMVGWKGTMNFSLNLIARKYDQVVKFVKASDIQITYIISFQPCIYLLHNYVIRVYIQKKKLGL